eukprot:TRINITY_DN1620_c0_g1_i2.p2 TRINITY_DN1620_c0_g1~~TRINITY_DN1620_c0_g1_i2.p2  ORF type:complete len:151 (-),score=0.13 TRINITY_DN1620_c0_g1_i2:194-610(-)
MRRLFVSSRAVLALPRSRPLMAPPTFLRFSQVLLGPKVRFTTATGDNFVFEAQPGENVMQVGVRNNLDIEAACDGKCMCSTCHVYVENGWFDKLKAADDDEEDMLDLALDRQDNSRLACQVRVCSCVCCCFFRCRLSR